MKKEPERAHKLATSFMGRRILFVGMVYVLHVFLPNISLIVAIIIAATVYALLAKVGEV